MNDSTPRSSDRPARRRDQLSGGSSTPARHVHCRFSSRSSATDGLVQEIAVLLRTRLRLASVIILAALTLYLVRNLFEIGAGPSYGVTGIVLHGAAIAATALASLVLLSWRPLSLPALRCMELAVFGIVAAFFVWLQWEFFLHLVNKIVVDGSAEPALLRHSGVGNALRWFILIVIYGVFIPNTWRRCAAIVGAIGIVAIGINLVGFCLGPVAVAYVKEALPDTIIILGTAAAVAIFGSYRIRQLQEKAYEAQKIGQYRLTKKLGTGGMGDVYLAEHVMLRRPCAIKLIRPDQAIDPNTLARFEREVRTTATLTHWNTVEIFDYGHTEDGTFYYVMEYLPGLTLEDLVDQHGALPPERVVHFLRQVCQALSEAHRVGLIHRDIKPGNIFACERGKVFDVAKLLDFGLVKTYGFSDQNIKLTQEGTLAGSPAYMSPEQATGREQLDARSDIYSLGAVAYFLLTGQLPFDRDTALQMLHAHAYENLAPTPEFREDVPADVQRIILRCLEKDPEHRFQDVLSLEVALSDCGCADDWTREKAELWWTKTVIAAKAAEASSVDERVIETIVARPY
jgi:serine/threonine-protein kinase